MDLIVKHDAHNKEQAAAGKPHADPNTPTLNLTLILLMTLTNHGLRPDGCYTRRPCIPVRDLRQASPSRLYS